MHRNVHTNKIQTRAATQNADIHKQRPVRPLPVFCRAEGGVGGQKPRTAASGSPVWLCSPPCAAGLSFPSEPLACFASSRHLTFSPAQALLTPHIFAFSQAFPEHHSFMH